MCGIAGCLESEGGRLSPSILDGMIEIMRHRGPDDEGCVAIDPNSGRWTTWRPQDGRGALEERGMRVGLAHARLSILDLSTAGHQPMTNADGSVWLVYNGELYNYVELREELRQRGRQFRTRTDTEVLLAAYEMWGEACVNRFNGMWAFALWDQRRRRLFCSRDRFGVKPFYYRWDGRRLVFASELKGLLTCPGITRQPNSRAIFRYLHQGFGYTNISEETFFEGIQQLMPGSVLTLSEGQLRVESFWELPYGTTVQRGQPEEYVEELRRLLMDAVRIRLRADVTMGSTLSGGLDSSSVTSLALSQGIQRPWHVFSACFDDPAHDERRFVAALADRPDVTRHDIFPDPQGCWQTLPQLLWHIEEPFPHLNVFSLWLLMKAAHQAGVRVVLNGHGGDEGLAGYRRNSLTYCADLLGGGQLRRWMTEASALKRLEGVPRRELLGINLRILFGRACPTRVKDAVRRTSVYRRLQLNHLQPGFVRGHADFMHAIRRQASLLTQASEFAYGQYPVPGWLQYEDRIGMAFNVEARSPFLDYRLVEFLMGVPASLKIRRGVRKWVLREAMRGHVPEAIRQRADKQGFPTPSESWFRGELRETIRGLLSSSHLAARGYLEPRRIVALFDRHCAGSLNLRLPIWRWVNLELWCRTWCDGALVKPTPMVERHPGERREVMV